ncbi:hypothetical protein HanXRQr2_Chr14g0658051 [Helianthus annuus]|uniref:Uncharacterized protein n=1 Tax=Helianthus annuus TaxID=4232 RepID=A0A9K3ED59_HELAN|nr:hypothetical protein HanXRQr2_Chr14g0658051 [Helianthus annuus]
MGTAVAPVLMLLPSGSWCKAKNVRIHSSDLAYVSCEARKFIHILEKDFSGCWSLYSKQAVNCKDELAQYYLRMSSRLLLTSRQYYPNLWRDYRVMLLLVPKSYQNSSK